MPVFTSKQVLRLKINRAMGMVHANSLTELLSRKAAVTMNLTMMACPVTIGPVSRVNKPSVHTLAKNLALGLMVRLCSKFP